FFLLYTSVVSLLYVFFFFSSRRRHTRWPRDWSSDVCSSDLLKVLGMFWGQLRVKQEFGHSNNAVHRCSDFVTLVGEEFAFRPVCCFCGCLGRIHLFQCSFAVGNVFCNTNNPPQITL